MSALVATFTTKTDFMKLLKGESLAIIFCLFFTTTMYGQIWTKPPLHRLTSQEYKMTLDFWGEKYADILEIEKIGKSDGETLYLLKITDRNVPDDDKQIALFTCLHGGPERSGTTSILKLTEWLLSNEQEAIDTRKNQIVLVIPIILPKSYFETDSFLNTNKIDPYTGGGISNWDLNTLTYKKLDEVPEIEAFIGVVDKYKPEAHLDLHGTGLQEYSEEQKEESNHQSYRGQTMFEVSGMAYSNSLLRPWDWRITEAMVKAGVEAGFPTDRGEADAQQSHWGPGWNQVSGKVWRGRPQFYTAQYSYLKYHTIVGCLENSWEQSGVARSIGLLRIGNNIWDGENKNGYPVNRVLPFLGKYVTSWGQNTSEMRQSRVELWDKQVGFSPGILYPETEGLETFVVGLTKKGNEMLDEDLDVFVSNLKKDKTINAEDIEAFIKNGPQIKMAFEKAKKPEYNEDAVTKGLGLRIRIQYKDAVLQNVKLNGHLLQPSAEDGYESWIGNGYLQLQVNVPPSKASKMDIAIVTCEYDTKTKRTYGWKPPQEVLDKIYNK